MDDSALDLPSSPDPLADEVASSVRPGTRRTTISLPPQDHTLPSSSPRRSSARSSAPGQSPRKRTFELDVGNENSPQKILVTVEAEEALKRGIVQRKLFIPSSPTQASRLTKNTTTTTVPLNDDDTKTPRRRGRPRRTSNGTPMPTTRKRSGTPIKRTAKHARHSGEPESEAGIASDALIDTGADGGEDTPMAKPKGRPRTRKTPKKSATPAVPSSQVSGQPTGRKRGRPRKSLMPAEVVDLAKARAEASLLASGENAGENTGEKGSASEALSEFVRGGQEMTNDDVPLSDFTIGEGSNATPRPNMYRPRRVDSIQRTSASRNSSHQELGTDNYFMSEDPPGIEPQSDIESDMDIVEGVTYTGQDTLAHASDFSMIAVESLPSFQASFQANISGIPEEPEDMGGYEEMGEETSQIVHETLKSLRESMQANESHQPSNHRIADNSTTKQDQLEAQDRSMNDNSGYRTRALSKSPRRPKSLPLNRQVFVGKAPHVDDSFSSIPDSILHAATPGRLPMKPTSAPDQTENEDAYDDSFSEIPDAVLEDATPRPATRTTMPAQASTGNQTGSYNSNSNSRSPGSSLGTARLPTPDDTSSSNAGSFRVNDDDNAAGFGAQVPAASTSHLDLPSSPPAMARPRAMDYGQSEMQEGMNGDKSSPDVSPSAKVSSDKARSDRLKSHEGPVHTRRPTLSPIVRVGRTLQNVMSDRSSPDGRESSLGSPFRGSYSNEMPRQSASRSPASSSRRDRQHSYTQPSFNSIAALAQSIGPSSGQGQRRSSHNNISTHDSSHSRSFKEPVYNSKGQLPRQSTSEGNSAVKNSTKVVPPSDNEIDWLAEVDSPQTGNDRHSLWGPTGSAPRDTTTGHATAAHTAEIERMQEDEADELGDGLDDDDFDMWDIEASRPSPGKLGLEPQPEPEPEPEVEPEVEQVAPESDVHPRRNKITSPWRRSGRRLIYQDDFPSALQIEIGEDSGRSEPDEDPLARPKQRPRITRPTAQDQNLQEQAPREPSPPEQFSPEQSSRESSPSDQPSPEQNSPEPNSPEPNSPEQNSPEQNSPEHSSPETGYEERPWEPMSDGQKLPTPSERQGLGSRSRVYEQSSERANGSEYSMLPHQADEAEAEAEAPATQKKPAQSKSRFFGGFDILSFFSSPATLPQQDTSKTKPAETPSKLQRAEQPVAKQTLPKEPQASLWSTGLFRPIPQKEFRPSPERRVDLFSPGPAHRSNDSVPETGASPDSSSASHQSSPSAAPSTPERQVFPSIEQKQNFTPRPGQSGSSLFTTGQAFSGAGRNGGANGFLQVPSDEPESSILTEGSEYERLPPREKPSRWDRTLSPTKSCFRSPLKPTTPGRVVAFSGNTAAPPAQPQLRGEGQFSNGGGGAISQGPPVRPSIEGKENQPVPNSEDIIANINADKPVSPEYAAPATAPVPPALSARERVRERAQARRQIQSQSQPQSQLQPRISHASTSSTSSTSSSSSAHTETNTNANHSSSPPPLSPTTWTKQHWILLDEMLQLRRRCGPEPQSQFRRRFPLPTRDQRSSASASLLGQEVMARGARLRLEGWHLDVVEAFRLEVGGWDERALAKRLFALIVGEERRREGKVGGGKGKGKGVEVR